MSTFTRPGPSARNACRRSLLALALGAMSALAFALPPADTDQPPRGAHAPADHAEASGHAASTPGNRNPERQRPTGSNEGSGAGHGVSGTTSSGSSGANQATHPGRVAPAAPGAEIGGGRGEGGAGNSGAIGNAGASPHASSAAPGSAASSGSSSGADMRSNAAASTSSTTGMKRRQP